MATATFTYVPLEGFAAFNNELDGDVWGKIATTGWEGPNNSAAKPLGDAPALVLLKILLRWGIASLVSAVEGAASASDCDVAWDGCQKQLNGLLIVGAASANPQKREAAVRLQKELLLGAGTAQTKLKYQQEVDFGRKQLLLLSQGQGAADATLLGLADVQAEIAKATDALAAAIGYGENAGRPFERRAAAVSSCRATFADVAGTLQWLSANGMPGADREQASALLATLEAVVARYPAPAPAQAAETPEAPPPVAETSGG